MFPLCNDCHQAAGQRRDIQREYLCNLVGPHTTLTIQTPLPLPHPHTTTCPRSQKIRPPTRDAQPNLFPGFLVLSVYE